MTNSYQAWRIEKTPIYSRMPELQTGISYKDFPATKILLNYWDSIFVECLDKLEDLVRQFNPELCDEEYLDFLAPLCGWTEPYWSGDYPPESKRLLLKNSYTKIWNRKGTKDCISFVLTSLGIRHRIIIPGNFIIGVSQVSIDPLGSTPYTFYVYLSNTYELDGYEFKLTDKMCQLFAPVWCEYLIDYDPYNLV